MKKKSLKSAIEVALNGMDFKVDEAPNGHCHVTINNPEYDRKTYPPRYVFWVAQSETMLIVSEERPSGELFVARDAKCQMLARLIQAYFAA